jgi:hypothetical protein
MTVSPPELNRNFYLFTWFLSVRLSPRSEPEVDLAERQQAEVLEETGRQVATVS